MAPSLALPRVLFWLVCAGIFPLFVLFSIWVTFQRPSVYASDSPIPLSVRVVADPGEKLTAATALQATAVYSPVDQFSNDLSEQSFWIQIDLSPEILRRATWLEFPSRHIWTMQCWEADSMQSLGSANHDVQEGRFIRSLGGFALNLKQAILPSTLICRSRFMGPARFTAQLRNEPGLMLAQAQHGRLGGVLFGSLFSLILLAVALSVTQREPRFLLLSVWLMLSLRMGQMTLGTDELWFSHSIEGDWLPLLRRLTIAGYFLVTLMLHSSALSRVKSEARVPQPIRLTTLVAGCLLVVLSCVLSYQRFLPIMWGVVAAGILVMTVDMTLAWVRDRSKVAVAYMLAVLTVMIGASWEIAAAYWGVSTGVVNHLSATLLSALLIVLAQAEHLAAESREKLVAQTRLGDVYKHVPIGLFSASSNGQFLNRNPAFDAMLTRSLQRSGGELLWPQLFPASDLQRLVNALRDKHHADLQVLGFNGRTYRISATRRRAGFDGSIEDITDKVTATAKLQFLAEHDALTGLYARHQFDLYLADSIARVRSGVPASLISFNLRRFRLVNSLHGLQAGDTILKQVAERLMRVAPNNSTVGRLSSDTFLMLCNGVSAAALKSTVAAIMQAIGDEPFNISGLHIQISLSAGIIDLAPSMKEVDAIAGVEFANRRSSSEPASIFVLANDSPAFTEWLAIQNLIRRIRQANGFEGLYLVAQPILSLLSPEKGRNFEVLLRMKDVAGPDIPVSRLLAAAEGTGMMTQLDLWVVEQTLEWLHSQRSRLDHIDFVCVNLSGAAINDALFMGQMLKLLESYESVARLLCLEITETIAIENFERCRDFMNQLRRWGVRFALDDFGAGHTSFRYLTELSAEVLKIDGTLIVNLAGNLNNQAVIAGIARMSKDLAMSCIAEWVNDEKTLDFLIEAGIDYAQGFAISKPIPIARLGEAQNCLSLVEDIAMREHLVALGARAAPGVH